MSRLGLDMVERKAPPVIQYVEPYCSSCMVCQNFLLYWHISVQRYANTSFHVCSQHFTRFHSKQCQETFRFQRSQCKWTNNVPSIWREGSLWDLIIMWRILENDARRVFVYRSCLYCTVEDNNVKITIGHWILTATKSKNNNNANIRNSFSLFSVATSILRWYCVNMRSYTHFLTCAWLLYANTPKKGSFTLHFSECASEAFTNDDYYYCYFRFTYSPIKLQLLKR